MFGKCNEQIGEKEPGPRELVRLVIPRRVYIQNHVVYIMEEVAEAFR